MTTFDVLQSEITILGLMPTRGHNENAGFVVQITKPAGFIHCEGENYDQSREEFSQDDIVNLAITFDPVGDILFPIPNINIFGPRRILNVYFYYLLNRYTLPQDRYHPITKKDWEYWKSRKRKTFKFGKGKDRCVVNFLYLERAKNANFIEAFVRDFDQKLSGLYDPCEAHG